MNRVPKWIVLLDISTEWPEVFGPFTLIETAQAAADKLLQDSMIDHVEVQAIFDGDSVEEYLGAYEKNV